MRDLRCIVQGAPAHLRAGGWLLIEHGYDQQEAVLDLFTQNNFIEICGHADTADVPRVVSGRQAMTSA